MMKSLAHWGSSSITGRGLLALAGRGSIAQIVLESEESYIAHPRFVRCSKEVLVLTPTIQQCCRILEEQASAAAVSPEILILSSPDTQSQHVCAFSGYQILPGNARLNDVERVGKDISRSTNMVKEVYLGRSGKCIVGTHPSSFGG